MSLAARLSFAFTADGRAAQDRADMSVTYVGRINRKQAEADARRRFEEWRSLANPLARRWASNQIVVS
ncbi:hypothetical protein [Magnetospirillum sp. UT-4]|uniref:hypothetical protein n=1 Tax=Magnetospirillum sp. UT-4 TaxID=2681467 RepID=UPI00137D4EF8|nr:hypothetical protein [Magnetospirillum sp. UT-4]CAA7615167.1 conserved hypothetical protein [Magnetospirillum sp. UT-4]